MATTPFDFETFWKALNTRSRIMLRRFINTLNNEALAGLKKEYIIELTQAGEDHPTGTVYFDELGGVDIVRYDVGIYHIIPKVAGAFIEGRTLPNAQGETINLPDGITTISIRRMNADLIELRTIQSGFLLDGLLYYFPLRVVVFNSQTITELEQSTLPVSRPKGLPTMFSITSDTPNSTGTVTFDHPLYELEEGFVDSLVLYNGTTEAAMTILGDVTISESDPTAITFSIQGAVNPAHYEIQLTYDATKTLTFNNLSTCDEFERVVDSIY